jgi:3-hydroxy-9,10-secoandrosta-1,3,5(10)-triene-9,17-dione monooxygenase reductase component
MIDSRTFRNVLGRFATGVCVVAIGIDEGVHAMTANAVCALSLEPPQVLFCPNKLGRFAQLLPRAERFSMSFLREEQQALSTYFAGGWKDPQPPPFRFVQDHGAPRLEGSLSALVCEKQALHDGGDHLLVIGRVIALHQGLEPHYPLLFFKGKYQSMERTDGKEAPLLADVTDEPPTVYYH